MTLSFAAGIALRAQHRPAFLRFVSNGRSARFFLVHYGLRPNGTLRIPRTDVSACLWLMIDCSREPLVRIERAQGCFLFCLPLPPEYVRGFAMRRAQHKRLRRRIATEACRGMTASRKTRNNTLRANNPFPASNNSKTLWKKPLLPLKMRFCAGILQQQVRPRKWRTRCRVRWNGCGNRRQRKSAKGCSTRRKTLPGPARS